MAEPKVHELARLTWPEARSAFATHPLAVWPLGSTEPHGPHLALATDTLMARGMATRAAHLLAAMGHTVLVLPEMPLGVTEFGRDFAGALSIAPQALVQVVVGVAQSLKNHGARALALCNAHLEPAQLEALHQAAHQACAQTGLPVSFMDKTRPEVARTLTAEFRSGACHAGQYETSAVLAEEPDAVRTAVMAALPEVDVSLSRAIRAGTTSFMEAGGTQAYFGNPAAATAKEGQATLERLAQHVVRDLMAMVEAAERTA